MFSPQISQDEIRNTRCAFALTVQRGRDPRLELLPTPDPVAEVNCLWHKS